MEHVKVIKASGAAHFEIRALSVEFGHKLVLSLNYLTRETSSQSFGAVRRHYFFVSLHLILQNSPNYSNYHVNHLKTKSSSPTLSTISTTLLRLWPLLISVKDGVIFLQVTCPGWCRVRSTGWNSKRNASNPFTGLARHYFGAFPVIFFDSYSASELFITNSCEWGLV